MFIALGPGVHGIVYYVVFQVSFPTGKQRPYGYWTVNDGNVLFESPVAINVGATVGITAISQSSPEIIAME